MTEKKVTIQNKAGIHCRPASVILSTISSDFPGNTFTLFKEGEPPVELNSILSLISLGLHCRNEAVLKVEGPNEQEACDKIAGLLENEFDFPPRE
ncbi:MAG: HPr family phosphocarrier protein [Victivallaceae bacterium]|nr:HPr family phosphocarrier protein [Victivallaceae bacterium]